MAIRVFPQGHYRQNITEFFWVSFIKQFICGNIQGFSFFGKKNGKVGEVTIETDHMPIEGVDTVTLYLNPKNQREYFDYILELKPNRIIFNPGTENEELIKA